MRNAVTPNTFPLVDMIREDLVAERIAIDSYREMIQFVGDHDPTRRRVLEEILATEEKHADDPVSFIEEIENWPRASRRAET